MKNKRFTAKILIDIGMTICLLLLMPYSLLSETAHEWIGMAMLVLFIAHHMLNRKWLLSIGKGKYNAFRVIQTVLVIIMFILMILALSLFIFGKRVVLKKVGFISAIFFFLVTILANIFASEQKSELINHDNAIIMAPSVTVKSTPNQSGTDLFILHEGRKVIIKDNTMKEWKEIKLEDGNVGWVPTNVIENI